MRNVVDSLRACVAYGDECVGHGLRVGVAVGRCETMISWAAGSARKPLAWRGAICSWFA